MMSDRLLANTTPRADGFYAPAEWEPHAGCWMVFPHRADTWRENAHPAQAAFMHVAATISRFEPVKLCVAPHLLARARSMLPVGANIRILSLQTDDAWLRDTGPSFVVDATGQVRGVDWRFNAWGEIFRPYDKDAAIAGAVLDHLAMARYNAPLVTEGGALHVDGAGTLIATRESIINPNRNPGLSASEVEQHLYDYLGVRHIIWVERGVYEDETDGHVDNLCCFVAPGQVALTWTDDQHDPQYERSHAAYETLRQSRDANGWALSVHKLHQPGPLYMSAAEAAGLRFGEGSHPRQAGARLAGSYVNYYLANGAVIVPQFDDPHDVAALMTLSALFPARRVLGVPAREILLGGGCIHCITHEQPIG